MPPIGADAPSFLSAGGEMADCIRNHDWSSTLGSPEEWPQSLKTLVTVMLGSTQPMFVAWGPNRTLIYNDPYAIVLANKHLALGQDFLQVWHEIRTDLEPLVAKAYRGEPSRMDDIELVMQRKGYPEVTHWTYSYTPIHDGGAVAGFFCPCHEITDQVVAERTQAFRVALEDRIRGLTDPTAVMNAAVELLGRRLGANRAGYGEVQADDATVVLHSCFADEVEPLTGPYALDAFGPDDIARQRRGESRWCDDLTLDPGQDQAVWAAIDTRAYASVPLVRDGRFTASLYVNYQEPHRWSAQEIALLEEVAARTWSAVERARAEGRLRESEEQLRFAHQAGRIGTWTLDLATNVMTTSEACRVNFGRDPDQPFPYADLIGCVHPDDQERMRAAVAHSIETGGDYDIEYRLKTPSGEIRWIHIRAQPSYHADGTPRALSGVSIDITARARAETALHETSDRLWLATENAEIGSWDVDVINDQLIWPARTKAMFGISPDIPVTMQDFYDGLHPEDREATSAAYAAAADPNTRALYDVEYRTIGKEDGVVRWVAAKGRGVFDEAGRCVRVIGTAIDITARRQIEQRLRDLNETLGEQVAARTGERNQLWELSRDVMLRCGFDGCILTVNPAWTEVLGWQEDELVGSSLYHLIHPDDLERTRRGAASSAEGSSFARFENRFRHRDGHYRWISWSTRPTDTVITAVGRDVTVERDAAEALARTEEALRQSQKMEAVGQLTGGLAHDFNNLLAGISGALELMNVRISQGRLREVDKYVIAAQGATKRAAALTHRLLAFSRRQTLLPKLTNVNRLVSDMLDLVQRTVGPSIQVENVAASGLWASLVDPSQLENALLNLCINARDAMPEGGRLTIETCNRWVDRPTGRKLNMPEGQYLSLCVSDTGVGMTPEVIEKAFDPFFTTKPIGEGTGLGLSMIYGFAKQSGGQVRIYSEVGQGTMVCIYLPRHAGEAGTDETGPEPAVVGQAEAGETVLVVDDEPTVRLLVTDVLEELGYTAIEASDSATGLRVLQSDARIDLLISDVGLPGGMNGRQMADAGREARPDLKVLFITGFAENALLNGGHLHAGMTVLTKPFAIEVLAARIRELVVGASRQS